MGKITSCDFGRRGKEREKEGGRKEGTVKTDGFNLTREDDRRVSGKCECL